MAEIRVENTSVCLYIILFPYWVGRATKTSHPDIKCTSLLLLEIVIAQQPYNFINSSSFLLTRFHCNRLYNEDYNLHGLKWMGSEILQSDWDARFLAPCTSWAMACHQTLPLACSGMGLACETIVRVVIANTINHQLCRILCLFLLIFWKLCFHSQKLF